MGDGDDKEPVYKEPFDLPRPMRRVSAPTPGPPRSPAHSVHATCWAHQASLRPITPSSSHSSFKASAVSSPPPRNFGEDRPVSALVVLSSHHARSTPDLGRWSAARTFE